MTSIRRVNSIGFNGPPLAMLAALLLLLRPSNPLGQACRAVALQARLRQAVQPVGSGRRPSNPLGQAAAIFNSIPVHLGKQHACLILNQIVNELNENARDDKERLAYIIHLAFAMNEITNRLLTDFKSC
jgi:hypothetical protein